MNYQETIVLSLGGSLIAPQKGIDIQFLNLFSKFVRKQIADRNRRFFIICGGGATARNYIDAGTAVFGKSITYEDKDWLGIHSTRLNAHLVRTIFRDIANPVIIEHYDEEYDVGDSAVIVCSGWKPGWSTDYCSVLIAEQHGAKTIINMSNIDKVYNKDPRLYKDAQPIEKTTWDYFETLVGSKWTPGLNAPFDPIATQKAKQLELNVIILNGKNIKNLENAISGHKFVGTVIAPFTLDASFYDREYYHGKKGEYSRSWIYYSMSIRALYRAFLIKVFFKPKKVLDVGCGLGHFIHYLRRLGVEAYGLELSQYAVDNALQSIRQYIKQGDIRKIPYKDNSFDLVTTFDVFEHIHQEDIEKGIDECARVSSNMQFHKIFTLENTWLKSVHGTDLSHVSVFNRDWWMEIWKKKKLIISQKRWLKLPDVIATSFLLEK